MLSKRALIFSLMFAPLLAAVGCSQYLNGKKQGAEVIELSDDDFACLKVLPAQLRKLSVGEATDQEVSGGFSCVESALKYFNKRTVGSTTNAYTAEDMRKFFGKYFLKENNVTPELAQELMKLKKALLGGSAVWVTKDEIEKIVSFLNIAKDEVIHTTPYIKLLLMEKDQQQVDWKQVTNATEQLRLSMRNLLKNTDLTKSDYTFEDLKKLSAGMSVFIGGGEELAPYAHISDWIPLAQSIKNVLIGTNADFTGFNDWSLGLDNIIDLYGTFLRFHYVVQNHGFSTPQDLRQLSQFGEQLYKLLMNSYQMTKTGQILFSDIDALIDQLLVKFNLPYNVTAASIKETYRVLVLNVLEPSRHGESRGLYALTQQHMLGLKRELNVWRLSQSFVDTLPYDGKGEIARADLLKALGNYNFNYVIDKALDQDAIEQDALARAWGDFVLLLQDPHPVTFNAKSRYDVFYQQNRLPQTWKSLTKFNLMRSLTRVLMIGYGDKNSLEMSQAALSDQGLIKWYDDFRAIGLEIKAFDPRGANSGHRSFMEANFFTFSGNGDNRMDFKEAFQFISILFSAGLGSGSDIQAGLGQAGCEVPQVDVFGYRMFTESCFKADLRKNFAVYFDNEPGMAQFVGHLSDADWDAFYGNLISFTRDSDPARGLVEMSDIRTAVVVLHYVETLMVMYDGDGNQSLSLDEIRTATTRFMSFLRDTNPGTGDGTLRDGFAYLVINGQKPSAWELARFKAGLIFSTPAESTRLNIIKVLRALKDDLNKSAK